MTSISHRRLGARILVVDDSAVMRRTLRNLLETHDEWKVCDEASDGREAVAKFDEEKFDVIVLDFQMPIMNGLGLLRAIAGQHQLSQVPLIVWTGSNDPGISAACTQAGATFVKTKPSDFAEHVVFAQEVGTLARTAKKRRRG